MIVENVRAALLISAVGMGLVFGVILLLWGLIALVVRLGADRRLAGAGAGGPDEEGGDGGEELDGEEGAAESLKAAAAAAVAAYIDGERRTPRP